MNDSNKILTPISASTTTTNNTNGVNANNSENKTSSKLISSSIDEESKESEKCSKAAKEDAKEKIPVLNSEQLKKRNYAYRCRFDVSWIERGKTLQK